METKVIYFTKLLNKSSKLGSLVIMSLILILFFKIIFKTLSMEVSLAYNLKKDISIN